MMIEESNHITKKQLIREFEQLERKAFLKGDIDLVIMVCEIIDRLENKSDNT